MKPLHNPAKTLVILVLLAVNAALFAQQGGFSGTPKGGEDFERVDSLQTGGQKIFVYTNDGVSGSLVPSDFNNTGYCTFVTYDEKGQELSKVQSDVPYSASAAYFGGEDGNIFRKQGTKVYQFIGGNFVEIMMLEQVPV